MNFLGHLYLSGDDPLVITGNFMADAIKGTDLSRFPEGLQRGIRLHRAIDHYIDQHPLARAGRDRARAHAGRYAPVVLDLFYDHLLAAHWSALHPEPLEDFTARMYEVLQAHAIWMEGRPARMLPHLVADDWLGVYARREGLSRALQGMSRRAPEGEVMAGAEAVLWTHYDDYRAEFIGFLTDIERATRTLR
jgi:acyl carrier protein phosphodiesterase